MPATFACPACRTVITPPEHGPIVKVRCPKCSTLVDLPYLRRRDTRRRRRSSSGWAWVVIALALVVIASTATFIAVRARMRAERLQVFEDLIAAAEDDEHTDRFSAAVNRLTTAIQMAEREGYASKERLDDLARRRARLLAADRAVRTDEIEAKSRADATAAEALAQQGDAQLSKALDLCESAYTLAGQVESPSTAQTREVVRDLATRLIAERGVNMDLQGGTFLDGSDAKNHFARLEPILANHLLAHGYLPRRAKSPLSALWDAKSPFHLGITIVESNPGTYLDSVLRTARIDCTLELQHRSSSTWRNRATGQTRTPSPGMSAFQSRILASARKPDPALERMLYDDAVKHLIAQLPSRLTNLPDFHQLGK